MCLLLFAIDESRVGDRIDGIARVNTSTAIDVEANTCNELVRCQEVGCLGHVLRFAVPLEQALLQNHVCFFLRDGWVKHDWAR